MLKIDKGTPDTQEIAHELIKKGNVLGGYTLIYLQQIRDLLVEIVGEVKE